MIQDLLSNQKKRDPINWGKVIWKISKALVILFFVIISFWGCGQQIFDGNVMTYNEPGAGFEICINPNVCTNGHVAPGTGVGFIFYNFLTNFPKAMQISPFYGLFVYPFALLTRTIGQGVGGGTSEIDGVSFVFTIFIVVILIRGAITLLTYKQFGQQLKMQSMQIKVAKIKAKYADQGKDLATKQKMQMELMALNKKYGINPIATFASTFITLPFFYSMYRVFSSLRILKNSWIFSEQYKVILSPFHALFTNHYWIYLIWVVFLIPLQVMSYQLPSILAKKQNKGKHITEATKKQMKQQKMMINIISFVFIIMAFELPISIGIYWIFSSTYTILQTILVYKWQNKKRKRMKSGEDKGMSIFSHIKSKWNERKDKIRPEKLIIHNIVY